MPGKGQKPRRARDEGSRFGQHVAPARNVRRRAKPEKVERGGPELSESKHEARLHEKRRDQIRQDMFDDQPDRAGAHAARGFDVGFRAQAQRETVDDAGGRRHVTGADGDDRIGDARPEDDDEPEREQQRGKRHQHVDHPHQDMAEPRKQRGKDADRNTRNKREGHHARADQQRHARRIDRARQRVAAVLIGAEPVGGIRRHEADHRMDRVGIVRRQRRRKNRGDHHRQKHAKPGQRDGAREKRREPRCDVGAAHCSSTRGSRKR